MKLSEAQIERQICDWLYAHRYFFWKQPNRGYFKGKFVDNGSGNRVMIGKFQKDHSPYAMKGIPDIIMVVNGRFIGLEVKSESGRQSDEQKEFERNVTKNGGAYYLIRSIEDVQMILKGI